MAPGIFDLTAFFTDSLSFTRDAYLVKRELGNKPLRYVNKFIPLLDATHWALKVGTNYYQLDTEGKHIIFSSDNEEFKLPGKKMTQTRMSHDRILREAEKLIQNMKERRQYSLLTNNCQDYAKMLAAVIDCGDPNTPQDLRGLLLNKLTGTAEGKGPGRINRRA